MFSRQNKYVLAKLFAALALLAIPVIAWANVQPIPITLTPNGFVVVSGNSFQATVTLDDVAPTGGQVVTINA